MRSGHGGDLDLLPFVRLLPSWAVVVVVDFVLIGIRVVVIGMIGMVIVVIGLIGRVAVVIVLLGVVVVVVSVLLELIVAVVHVVAAAIVRRQRCLVQWLQCLSLHRCNLSSLDLDSDRLADSLLLLV